MRDVLVIGGGISGLAAAWTLSRAGKEVVVLEAGESPGGNLATQKVDGYTLELGPHSFLPSSDVIWNLTRTLNLSGDIRRAESRGNLRWIWKEGRLRALPMSPLSFLTSDILPFSAKLRLAVEPFVRNGARPEDSAEAFFTRRLGAEAVKWLIGPFISGVYAGDPARLGAKDAFAKMYAWERDSGSMIRGARKYMKQKRIERGGSRGKGLFSFRGGLSALPSRLSEDLNIFCGRAVKGVFRTDDGWRAETEKESFPARSILLATPPDAAAAIVEGFSTDMAAEYRRVEMSPVAVLHMGIDGEDAAAVPDGFGFLVPRGQGVRTLGCIFLSKIYPDYAPEGSQLLTFYIGGVFDPEALALDEDALVRVALDDMETVLGRRLVPRFTRVFRHPQAIPQLVSGHTERVARLKELAAKAGNFRLAGNYLTGVGMNDAAESGLEAARLILEGDRP